MLDAKLGYDRDMLTPKLQVLTQKVNGQVQC